MTNTDHAAFEWLGEDGEVVADAPWLRIEGSEVHYGLEYIERPIIR
jgi:hypothetical protein